MNMPEKRENNALRGVTAERGIMMKKTNKLFGTMIRIVGVMLVGAFALGFTACDNGSGDPGNGGTAPSAAISGSVVITATKANAAGNGAAAANSSVTINLTNAKVNNALTATNASAWFTPTVPGLSYNASAGADATAITVAITGTPTATSDADATISIPAGILKDNNGTATTADLTVSGSITYNIGTASASIVTPPIPEPMSTQTAMQYFTEQGITIGINVGNTLDAVQFWTDSIHPTAGPDNPIAVETAWGNVPANQAYFNGLASLGFKIVRIPVTWLGHIGPAPNYTIEPAYLQRVAEVVNMAHTAGLKAFINIHHDGNHSQGYSGWLDITKAAADTTITDKYVAVWTQIAEYFKNYGDYLMFQSFNEIQRGDWDHTGTQAEYAIINDWNQRFTTAVRGTGGNNATRYLLYYGYMVSTEIAHNGAFFQLPNDPGNGTTKQIVGFHYYEPWDFSGGTTSITYTGIESSLASDFAAFKTKFVDNGIPVIIGENGPARYANWQQDGGNTGYDVANVETAHQNRLLFIDLLYSTARQNGIVPIYWENGSYDEATAGEGDFTLINRTTGQPNSAASTEVIQRMMTAIENTTPGGGGGVPPIPNTITGNMGQYTFGKQENGIDPNYTQAVWSLTGDNLADAKATGTKLVLVLNAAPSANLDLVWQGPDNNIWWKEAHILGNGVVLNAGSTTWNAGTNTLTIDLASALVDYSTFTTQPSLNIIVAYYGGSSVNDLGIVSANIVAASTPWVDPAGQNTPLSGGTELLSYSSGNKNLDGSPYGYETWDFDENAATSTNKFTWYGNDKGGGGAFKAEWKTYFLARLGYYWGNGGPYTQYKNIYVDYNFARSNNASSPSGGFIGVYGWSRNPYAAEPINRLIEYYIVDDWFYDEQMGISHVGTGQGADAPTELGSFVVDGATYKIYKNPRINKPSIDDTQTFIQIFSVRQGRRTSGTISVTEHFKAWSRYLELGNMYEAKFKVEAFANWSAPLPNYGYLDLRYLYLTQEETRRDIPAGTTPQ